MNSASLRMPRHKWTEKESRETPGLLHPPLWSTAHGISWISRFFQPPVVQNLQNEEGQSLCCLSVWRNFPVGHGLSTDEVSERRRRCESRAPGLPCTYCVARGLPCSSGEPGKAVHRHDQPKFADSFHSKQIDNCPLPTKSLCAELVQLYFDYIHDQFHTLFHPPSFVEDINRGQAPRILIYGMMALSARQVFLFSLQNQTAYF